LWTEHPAPPSWYAALSAEQAALWQTARSLEASHAADSAVAEEWRRLIEPSPPSQAQAGVDLALLRLELRTNSAAAIERLCRFAEDHPESPSESGLPLAAVSFAMAL